MLLPDKPIPEFPFHGMPGHAYLLESRVVASFHPFPISHLGKDVPDFSLSFPNPHTETCDDHAAREEGGTGEADLEAE